GGRAASGLVLVDDPTDGLAHLAADDHGKGDTADIPAAVRGVVALGPELVRIDGPAGFGVDQGYVGVRARAEGPLGDFQELGGVDGQLADYLRPREMAGIDQAVHGDRYQSLQPHDPEGGKVELAQLLLGRVRGVVGG